MADYKESFADAVRAALGSTPYRTIARKAGISASYVGDMVQGRIPSREVIIAFANAAGADPNLLLRHTKYALVTPSDQADSPEAVELALGRLIMDLREQFQTDRIALRQFGGRESLKTVADVEALRPILEEDIRQELAERAREKGGK